MKNIDNLLLMLYNYNKGERNMFCKYCGNKLDSEAMFCPNCGNPANDQINTPAPQVQTQAMVEPQTQPAAPTQTQPQITTQVKSSKLSVVGFVIALVSTLCLLNLLCIGLFSDVAWSIIISILFTPIGVTSLIFSIVGINQTKNEQMSKRGFAIAAFVLSICILTFVFILFNISCAR